jgi:group I intron endonuclease
MHMHELYLITNQVNGKRYVGQTARGRVFRWRQHVREANLNRERTPLHLAIRKYGPESFSLQWLKDCQTQAEVDAAEIATIALLGTLAPRGYNLTAGGQGDRAPGYKESEATRLAKARTWNTAEKRQQNSAAQKKAWERRKLNGFTPKVRPAKVKAARIRVGVPATERSAAREFISKLF